MKVPECGALSSWQSLDVAYQCSYPGTVGSRLFGQLILYKIKVPNYLLEEVLLSPHGFVAYIFCLKLKVKGFP